MNAEKIGNLIATIRKEKNLTQKELALQLNISDKTVSKWETGAGCPDIGILSELAKVLGINATEIIAGELSFNENEVGNMKKSKFYYCETCGNIVISTNELLLNCCGKSLLELVPNKNIDEAHFPQMENVEDEIFVHLDHSMEREHYLPFIGYVTCDKLFIQRLYPEQNAETRLKLRGHGSILIYCKQHGLFVKPI